MAQILVIEDEDNIRTMVRLALEHDGHTVGVAAGGMEGVRLFGDGRAWNVVLMDQRMPDMLGVETLTRLRARDGDAWVIMMTAMGTRELEDEARRAGATDFLRKPFTTETLRGAIAAALRGKKPLQSHADDNAVAVTSVTRNGFRIEHQRTDAPNNPKGGRGLAQLWDRIAHPDAVSSFGTSNQADGFETGFLVENPAGEVRECVVALSPAACEQVDSQAAKTRGGAKETVQRDARLLVSVCEEALYEYIWKHADFPPLQKLVVERLSSDLERFVAVSVIAPP